MAEEQRRDELVRDLVDGAGAEPVAGAQRLDHRDAVGGEAERVGVGVAEVDADGVASVPVDRVGDPVGDQVERVVPADLVPRAGGPVAADRAAQPVRVVVQVAERDALGADVAPRERVVGVAADLGDPVALDGDPQPADRLADVADPGHRPERRSGRARRRHTGIVPVPGRRREWAPQLMAGSRARLTPPGERRRADAASGDGAAG